MTDAVASGRRQSLLALIGPGLLVAATGVGAGDLATASFTGSQLGTAVLWAVLVGGFFKFVLTEGLVRWQLVTGQTLLEGARSRLGRWVGLFFLPYLIFWSFFVGSALVSACGVTLHALVPVFESAVEGKIAFGIVSSLVGLALVLAGGFHWFERVMNVCIGLMFVTVIVTAALLWPGTGAVLRGLCLPTIPAAGGTGTTWTVALIGGVGGTLTILCYGYWVREKGREGTANLTLSRLDLGLGYTMTILFGLAMVLIGSNLKIEGRGADLLVMLARQLEGQVGAVGRWVFLVGALGAVFSSLLGVWQAVPYIFADVWRLFVRSANPQSSARAAAVDTRSAPYRTYLLAIATIPLLGLFMSFKEVQKLYAVIGALFIPLLAAALLVLNGRRAWVANFTNRRTTVAVLIAVLAFFGWMAWSQWLG